MSADDPRVGFVSGVNGRGTFELVYTCLFTWFLCLWTAFHPNIPAANESRINVLGRRLVYMVIGALGPETNPSKSFEQWQDAKFFLEDIKKYKPPAPTTYQYDGPVNVSMKHEPVEIVQSSKREKMREGWKKSNPQNPGWTLRHGFYCNMGGYILCFKDKEPYPVSRIQLFKLFEKGYIEIPNPLTVDEIKDKSKTDSLLKAMAVLQTIYFIAQVIARAIQNLPISALEVATLAYIACMLPTIYFWWHKPQDVDTATPLKILKWDDESEQIVKEWPPMWFLWVPFNQAKMPRISNALVTNHEWPKSWGWQDARTWEPFVGTAIIFGAVHSIAWNFSFDTFVELWLWRVSSIVILSIGLFSVYASWWRGGEPNKDLPPLKKKIHDIGQGIVAGTYVVFRLYLFVEVWLQFRSMPVGVYQSVDWSKFYPSWN